MIEDMNEILTDENHINDTIDNKKQKILVIDDDGTHLALVRSILEDDYEVAAVKSGRDALGLFYQGLVPHLILLDIIMPEMDGWNTYSRIRAISGLYDIPIAFFTGVDSPEDLQRANEMGAVDYIKKPFDKDDLLNRIGKILGN